MAAEGPAALLLLLLLVAVAGGDDADWVRLPSKCEVCKYVALELKSAFEETGKTKEVIDTKYGFLDGKGAAVKYTQSDIRLIEVTENICKRLLDYNLHKERSGSNRFAKGMSETFETLHNLVHKGVKVVMDIPYELWNETSAEVADLKKQCDVLVEEYEDVIEDWYRHHQTEDLSQFLCADRVSFLATARRAGAASSQRPQRGRPGPSAAGAANKDLCRGAPLRCLPRAAGSAPGGSSLRGAGRRGVAAAIGGPRGRGADVGGGAGERHGAARRRRRGGGAATERGGGGMVDSVYRTRSLGVAAEGLPDQYADGRAAKVWQLYIGDTRSRTAEYRSWLLALLRQHRCRSVLDVACGTGVDSIMLLEEGFQVTSVDASDKMLKYALKERWERRKEEPFDRWVIEEANWLTLEQDLEKPGDGFDAVICLGNSFAHLPDFKGDQSDHKLALRNIASMVRPGGVLVIDHRNYDHILATGCAPPGKNIYYKSDLTKDITTSVLLVNNKAHMVTLDYTVQVPPTEAGASPELSKFRLSYYPHRLEAFTALLKGAFQGKCQHSVLGDFQPYTPGQAHVPCYFIHVVKKTA